MATKPQGNMGKLGFGPSDGLIAMFRACSRDPAKEIQSRLQSMLQMFQQHHRDNTTDKKIHEVAAKCCSEAGSSYYRILEKHGSQERDRLGISDISGIFGNDLIQRCMVACCLEITIFSNHLPCDFPKLLHILNLAPYHFWKVIELVLRADDSLPDDVITHLSQVEEKVVESLAWTGNSPLQEELRANGGHLPSIEQAMLPGQLEGLKGTDTKPGENSADGSGPSHQQSSPSAGNRPRKSTALTLFARKIYLLKSARLRVLCSKMNISDELRVKIWTCFEHSLVQHTHLMLNRHLDQLLLCAIYLAAKITNDEIAFKEIMNCYKSQPLAIKSVCKNVLISGKTDTCLTGHNPSDSLLTPDTPSTHYPGSSKEERSNLIDFYNQVYTVEMKDFAKQFEPTAGGDTPPMSPYPKQQTATPHRRRLSSRSSIFLSPFNKDTNPRPKTGLTYTFDAFKPGTSESLREINDMIKTSMSANKTSQINLFLDSEDQEGEDGSVAKRPRLDAQSALQRRLRNMMDDRKTRRDQDKKTEQH